MTISILNIVESLRGFHPDYNLDNLICSCSGQISTKQLQTIYNASYRNDKLWCNHCYFISISCMYQYKIEKIWIKSILLIFKMHLFYRGFCLSLQFLVIATVMFKIFLLMIKKFQTVKYHRLVKLFGYSVIRSVYSSGLCRVFLRYFWTFCYCLLGILGDYMHMIIR